jgi:F-box-like
MIVNEIVVRYHILDTLVSNQYSMAANTPFDSFIGTNFIPSESDVQLINDYLVKPLAKITLLDLEISRLQAERDDIYARVQPYKALLSPIRRLPLDIMEKIFLFCLPTQRNPAMSTLEAPLKLGRICSSWRSFAYSSPRLWSRIHISLLHLGEIPEISADIETDFEIQEWKVEEAMDGIRRHLDGVSGWLTRAESHPLSISIFGPRYSSRTSATLPLLQKLLPFAKQWQDLELLVTCDNSVILKFIQHFKLLEFPLLRSVCLRDVLYPDFPFDAPNPPSPFEWLSTPSLRSLRALSLLSTSLVKSGIHWPNLTELTLLGPLITPSDAASILIGCVNIVKCELEVSELSRNDGSAKLPESIELRQLKSLSFYEKVRFPVSLCLPRLCNLSFGSECLPDILRFDLPGNPILHGLTTLTLNLFGFTPEPVLECLSYTSSLKRLTFRALNRDSERHWHTDINIEIMAKVIEALTPIESDDLLVTEFCPNLETFECKMAPDFSDEALETLIIKRMSSRFRGSTLCRVAVDFTQYPSRPMTLDLWESLENVVDESFELDLQYIDQPDMDISPWSGVGTEEMVPEWALQGI